MSALGKSNDRHVSPQRRGSLLALMQPIATHPPEAGVRDTHCESAHRAALHAMVTS